MPLPVARAAFAGALLLAVVAVPAQQPTLPPNYVAVHAPMAQALVMRTKAAHPEIRKLGLHAVPPGETANAIIGSEVPGKVGKKSSDKDAANLATGKPTISKLDANQGFDLLLPITDKSGASLGDGFVVMEVPYASAADEAAALRIGTAIRDEMQRQIPSRAALYR